MFNELNAIIMPDGSLQLEQTASKNRISKSQHLLQDEFSRRFAENPVAALLYLGFCDKAVSLSDSLSFWRTFCGIFAERLRLTPEIEFLRERIEMPPDKDAINSALSTAPLMEGSEYLSVDLLALKWNNLHNEFKRQIKAFNGTIEEFIHEFSPQMHLVGRVYFHLVENKKGDLPFAFLATYSTALVSCQASIDG
jgi:non-specific serine/threonine protein kinase